MKQDDSFITKSGVFITNGGQRYAELTVCGRKFQRIYTAEGWKIGDKCFIGKIMNVPYAKLRKERHYKMAPFKIPEYIYYDGTPSGSPTVWVGKGRYLFIEIE